MMRPRPFARRREAKTLDKELGHGLWRQAHDRFARSLDRYWQIIDPQQPGNMSQDELNGLINAGNVLTDTLSTVRQMCIQARERFGERELDVPAGANDIHRVLSRAANDLAATAQAAALYKRNQTGVDTVGRRAEKVLTAIQTAQELMND